MRHHADPDFSTSSDLIHWSTPTLLFQTVMVSGYQCGGPDPIQYPSLTDPASTTRNFETTGNTAYLYYTQNHYTNCQQTLDRDLVRVPITISR